MPTSCVRRGCFAIVFSALLASLGQAQGPPAPVSSSTPPLAASYNNDWTAMLHAKDPMAVAVYVVFATGTFPNYCPPQMGGRCSAAQMVAPADGDKLAAAEQQLASVLRELGRARVLAAAKTLADAGKGFAGRFLSDRNLLADPASIGCKNNGVKDCFWELLGTAPRTWSRDFGREPWAPAPTAPGSGVAERVVTADPRVLPIFEEDDMLKGHKAMSVYAYVNGTRDVSPGELETMIGSRLQAIGITILPQTDPVSYPALRVTVDVGEGLRLGTAVYWTWATTVHFRQVFPTSVPSSGQGLARTSFWSAGAFGAASGLVLGREITNQVSQITQTFVDTYRRVNR
jgi:hypothetical protein